MYEVVKKKAKNSTMSLSAYGLNSLGHIGKGISSILIN